MSYQVTTFPTTLDVPVNPLGSNDTSLFDHAGLEKFQNDAIAALEAKVGVTGSAVTTSTDYRLSGVTGGDKAASKTGTETLTNKTLTTPTITGGGSWAGSPTVTTPVITTPTINVTSDATGDLHYRSSGGALARVGIGSTGQFLSVIAGLPVWTGTIFPSGSISMYAGASAPSGWLFCDGSAVSRATYANLFAVLSTTYGTGDGSTTFNVPDMRGRIPVGVGTGTGGASSGAGLPTGGSALTAVARGSWKGEETHVITIAEMPSHNHSSTKYVNGAGGGAAADGNFVGNPNPAGALVSGNVAPQGGDGAHNNIQPVMGLNFIIAQ